MDTKRTAKILGVGAAVVIGAAVAVGVSRTLSGRERRPDRRSKGTWQRVR